MPTLLVYRGKVVDREFDLHGTTIRIGRAHENDLVLEDPTKAVSRFHAELRWDGEAHYRITDLGSQNGTWVNGVRVEDARLDPGTSVAIGPYQLQLTQDTAAMGTQGTTAVTAAHADVSPAGDTPPILTAVVRGKSPGAPIGTPTPIRPQPPAPTPVPPAGAASPRPEPMPATPPVPPTSPAPAAVAAAPVPPKAAAGPAAKPAAPTKTTGGSGHRAALIGVAAAAIVVVGASALAWLMWTRTTAPAETPATAPIESAAPAEATSTAAEPQAPTPEPPPPAEADQPAGAATATLPAAPGASATATEAGGAAVAAAPARRRSDSATGLEQAPRETVSAFNARVKRAKETEGKLEAAFADNQVASAEAALGDLRQQAPAHPNLQAYDERLRTVRAAARQQQLEGLIAQGKAAEQRGELLAARDAYAEARRIDGTAAASEWAGLTTKLTQEGQRILRTAEQDMLLSRRRAKEALPMFRRALEYLPDGHPDRARAQERIREIEAQ